jgi:hypothetical protein
VHHKFARLEAQVPNISKSASIFMSSLEKNIEPFLKKLKSNEKPKYHEEMRKEEEEPKLEKGDSNNQYFQCHFKMEGYIDICPYKCDVDTIMLNH